jgi:hypothetical protein
VPLVAAAVCPHPPLIVPEIAGAAAPELDDLRAACDAAVARLVAVDPDEILLVGGGPKTEHFGYADVGSLRPYGVNRLVPLGKTAGSGAELLPLSLTIGAWLVRRTGTDLPIGAQSVATDAHPDDCAGLGSELVCRTEPRTALLVMGDGSACRGEKSPGYDDPRAQAYDDGVAAALAGADAEALLGLDPGLSAELKVAGRAPWQVLAAAARAAGGAAGGAWGGDLTYYAAPYGVAYFVATWEPA